MGYHVHILRTESAQVLPITKDEVRQAVIPMRGRLSVMPDKPELWLYQPALGEESEIVAFDDNDGSLWTASPSDPLLALMIELAGKLNLKLTLAWRKPTSIPTIRSCTRQTVRSDRHGRYRR
jgi:hypothetical protein